MVVRNIDPNKIAGYSSSIVVSRICIQHADEAHDGLGDCCI